MDLDAEASISWNLFGRFLLGVVDGLEVVEPDLDLVAFCVNAQLVPFTLGLGVFCQFILRCLGQHPASPGFII